LIRHLVADADQRVAGVVKQVFIDKTPDVRSWNWDTARQIDNLWGLGFNDETIKPVRQDHSDPSVRGNLMKKILYGTKEFVEIFALVGIVSLVSPAISSGGTDTGWIKKDGKDLFPIGCYELPKEDAKLQAMADAGFNLVRCNNREDLDRAQEAGMMGWIPLSLQNGPTGDLRKLVESVKDHPALAVWEGPDEVVWNFTAFSGLYKTMGVHKVSGEWWLQTENAVKYAEEQARTIIPNIRESIEVIRTLDGKDHPVWINEALKSDVRYVRQYVDWVDITGCDIYPVKKDGRNVVSVGAATERWNRTGRGKPVWMVLQAFSWHELGDDYSARGIAYPTFDESRFMAYDVVSHGAGGILYWGSHYLNSEPFRQSLYALTNELAMLQPFLTAPEVEGVRVNLIDDEGNEAVRGVRISARRAGDDWIIVLVNEDDCRHMGVEVTGLNELNGKTLHLLYGAEELVVDQNELIARLLPRQVKVYATGRQWETDRPVGRDFAE